MSIVRTNHPQQPQLVDPHCDYIPIGSFSQDPIGFAAGDANLYRYVGNGPLDSTDPSGLQEYVPGTAPPPNTRPLDRSDHASQETLSWSEYRAAWSMKARADITAAGGEVYGMPNSSALLTHFLYGNGCDYKINAAAMFNESEQARLHMLNELNKAMDAAELYARPDFIANIVSAAEVEAKPGNTEGDWLMAIGKFRIWGNGTATQINENQYQMRFTVHVRDNYDWEMLDYAKMNPAGGGLVCDYEMAMLDRWGWADEFQIIGEHTIVVTWTKGQRFKQANEPTIVEPRR